MHTTHQGLTCCVSSECASALTDPSAAPPPLLMTGPERLKCAKSSESVVTMFCMRVFVFVCLCVHCLLWVLLSFRRLLARGSFCSAFPYARLKAHSAERSPMDTLVCLCKLKYVHSCKRACSHARVDFCMCASHACACVHSCMCARQGVPGPICNKHG
jgi:hypothetical protein